MRSWALVFRRFWEKIKNIRPQNVGSLFLVLIIVGSIFLWVAPTFANEGLDEASNWLSRWISGFFLSVGSLCLQLTLFALKMFILVAGYNNYINAPVVQFGWNIIRDVANMFFVVILLVIAFGTILGLEQYEWRKTMAKLVFASIFVNFSNVICQLIIDISQVFTMTFLNAVAGTAAGNMIQMFNLQSVFQLVRRGDGESVGTELMIASLFAMIFTIIALCAIGSYLIVMLYRMVVLWCLIILSPLAFIFSILPGTKSYASDFWKEFTNHVIAAPVMVFFLWLAFSTFGGGDIVQSHIEVDNPSGVKMTTVDEEGKKMGASVSEASSFDNLANFVVAVAFLFMGMERVQKLGVKGGEFVQKGMDLGKKAVSYASGYRASKYMAGQAWKGTKYLAKTSPIGHGIRVGQEKVKQGWAKTLGKGAIQREASLELYKQQTKAVKDKIASQGRQKSGAREGLARDTVALQNQERIEKNQHKEVEADIKMKIISDDETEYNKRVNDQLNALGRPPSDRELADIQENAIKGLTSMEGMAAEGRSGRAEGKLRTKDSGMLAEVRDFQRVKMDNRKRKYRKEFEEKDWRENMEDFARSDYDERFEDIETEYKKVQALRAMPTRNKDQEKQLTAATKNLIQLTSSAFENEEGGALWGKLASLNTAWAGKPVTSDNEHEALLSLWTGKDQTGSANSGQNDLRGMFGKDWNVMSRNVMRAMNKSAGDTGNQQDRAQILKGKDEHGLDAFGFSNIMAGGSVSPVPGMIVTGTSSSGATRRQSKEADARSKKKLKDYKHGLNIIEARSGDGKAERVRKDAESVRAVDSLMSATAAELRNLDETVFNLLSGGTYDKANTYSSSSNEVTYDRTQTDLRDTVKKILDQKKANLAAVTTSGPEQDKRREDLVTFVRLLTKDATIDATKAGAFDVV